MWRLTKCHDLMKTVLETRRHVRYLDELLKHVNPDTDICALGGFWLRNVVIWIGGDCPTHGDV